MDCEHCKYFGMQEYCIPCERCITADTKPDNVEHPSRYTGGSIECIEAVKTFCICNSFKYLWRHDRKNGVEDVKKAVWYLNKFIELEEKER